MKTFSVGRVLYIDFIKCIGIFMVIFYHVNQYAFNIWNSVAVDIIYTFNMPLFFFVSGILVFKPRKTVHYYFSNLWKKVSMLLIPTIVFSLFWALSMKEDVDFFRGFGRYWFGVTLLECFIIYYIVSFVTKTEKDQLFIMTLLSIAGVGYLSTGVGDKYLQVLELNHLTKYLQFFTLGMFAKKFSSSYTKMLNSEIWRAIFIGLFWILFFILRYEGLFPTIMYHFLNDIVIRYLGLFMTILFLYNISIRIEHNKTIVKIVRIVAENSFSIYLLQYYFLPDFRGQEWIENIDTFSMSIICIFYSIICTIVCLGVIAIISRSNTYSRYVLGKR